MKVVFSGVRGIVVLDTSGNFLKLTEDINKQRTGLEVLQTLSVGCENVNKVVQEAIENNKKIILIR